MTHKDYIKQQEQILKKVLVILKQYKSVLGIIVTGSLVDGTNDAFSDIDMDCFLKDKSKAVIFEVIDKVSKLSPLLAKLWIYDKNALFLFTNGVRLDLNFNKISEIKNFEANTCKIIYDPKKLLEKRLSKKTKKYPHPKWNPDEFEYIEWYFWMFRQVYCWAKRAAQGSHKSFDKLHNAIDSLSQIRNGLIGIKLWLNGKWDYLKNIDPEFAGRISKTHPRFNADETCRCTRLLLDEFRELCKPYCEKRKVKYPAEKFKAMYAILDEFDKMG